MTWQPCGDYSESEQKKHSVFRQFDKDKKLDKNREKEKPKVKEEEPGNVKKDAIKGQREMKRAELVTKNG